VTQLLVKKEQKQLKLQLRSHVILLLARKELKQKWLKQTNLSIFQNKKTESRK